MKLTTKRLQQAIEAFRAFYRQAGVHLDEARLVVWADGTKLRVIAFHSQVWLVWEQEFGGNSFCSWAQLRHLAGLGLEESSHANVALDIDRTCLGLTCGDLALEIPMERGGLAPQLDYELELVWGPSQEWHKYGVQHVLRHLSPAVGQDPERPHLRAMALTGTAGVATDGHRLHMGDLDATLPEGRQTVVLPPLCLDVLARVIPGEAFKASIGERYFRVVGVRDEWSLYAELSPTPFPNWERVVPEPPMDFELEVQAFELAAALRHMQGYRLPCNLFFKGDVLELQPVAGSGIWGKASVPYKRIRGETPASMCFKPVYLLDALGEMLGSVVEIQGTDADGALLLHSENLLAIVMPMRR